MVDAAEARKDLFYGALIGHIHHDRVHLHQLQLGLEELVWGAVDDRDLRAAVPGPAYGDQAPPAAPTDHDDVSTFTLQ
jgi:hypothetical protein